MEAASREPVERLLRAVGVPSHRLEPRVADALQAVERQPVSFADGALAAWRLGDGPAVLLLHGWEDNHSLWSPLIDALGTRGRAVVAFDLPAHGSSDGEWGLHPQAIDGTHAVVAALGPIDAIVAHSSGCGVAGLAIAEGQRSERTVLIAPPMRSVNRFARYAERLGLASEIAADAKAIYEERIGPARTDFSLRRALPDLPSEVLIVHSRDDERNPFSDSEEVAASGDRVRLASVDGLTHRRTARDPEVVELIADFVTPRSSTGSASG